MSDNQINENERGVDKSPLLNLNEPGDDSKQEERSDDGILMMKGVDEMYQTVVILTLGDAIGV